MIVVDVNILVALELETDVSKDARRIAGLDPDWRLPVLWRSEFSNALRNFHRAGKIGRDEALVLLRGALGRYAAAETRTDEELSLGLSMDRGLTFYDASYLDLAVQLGTVLVTEDKELIKKSRGDAMSMSSWLSSKA